MSWFTSVDISCPSCGFEFVGHTADTINIARVPQARDLVIDGEFHVETCPSCQTRVNVDRIFMYTDFGRQQFCHVFRRSDEPRWDELEGLATRTFREGFAGSPPAMQTLAETCRVRAVFGVAALAEKVRIWDAELDDAIVELVKLELVTKEPSLSRDPNIEVLMIGLTDDGGGISLFVRQRDARPDDPCEMFAARRSRYDELVESRDQLARTWPSLFHEPYVSYRRLAREPVEAPL